ncbi:MAG: nitroreductase [Ectothiorhodospiraceae bacterium]|nr:nitroreductase [Ectothiorhodospiraceae bacterium]
MEDTTDAHLAAGPAPDVAAALRSRHSVRRYLPRPVERETVRRILDLARWAPSGSNTQPWKVYVLGGAVRDAVCAAALADAEANGERQEREYEYYPTDWYEPYLRRRRACGWGLYGSLGITRGEAERMAAQRNRNFTFFEAPVGLVLTIERRLNRGSWMDLGMFIQSVMLAARGEGLHTCAQAAFANYHRLLREHLSIPDGEVVVCGMALGYRDPEAPENVWRAGRDPVESFTTWCGL